MGKQEKWGVVLLTPRGSKLATSKYSGVAVEVSYAVDEGSWSESAIIWIVLPWLSTCLMPEPIMLRKSRGEHSPKEPHLTDLLAHLD